MTRSLLTFMQACSHLQLDLEDHSVRLIINQCSWLSPFIKYSRSPYMHSHYSISVFSWIFQISRNVEYHIFTLTFSSLLLTYQLLVPLKWGQRKKVAQLPKNINLILLGSLELLGYPTLVRHGSLRVRTKGKLHFKLVNYPVSWHFKDWSCKISLQTWRTFNLSPKIVFVINCYWLTISYTPLLAVTR